MPRSLDEHGQEIETTFGGLLLVPKDSGFRMDGYYVWGGSVIRVGTTYHMCASRWPHRTGFPDGYRAHSEIARAESDSPPGPYSLTEVVIAGRDATHWDGVMAHNPTIHALDDGYVLYYIGTPPGTALRKIGYATAPTIAGPWTRIDDALPLGEDANNPAPCFGEDGAVVLAFRDRQLRMGIATAPRYDGPYQVRTNQILPGIKLEDAYLYRHQGLHQMICEDNQAQVSGHERWGVHLISKDGVHG